MLTGRSAQTGKITVMFGCKAAKQNERKLQIFITDLDLTNLGIRNHYAHYVRDHLCLRSEQATNDVTDYDARPSSFAHIASAAWQSTY
jgi:hypothetical protein